jgi:hypothetical protein
MPYLTQEDKNRLAEPGAKPEKAGELNYLLTMAYIKVYRRGNTTGLETELWNAIFDYLDGKEMKYQLVNDVIGAISCSLLEFFHRILPTVDNDEEAEEFLHHLDERVTEFKVAVYNKIAVPYELKKREENGDVYSN